MAAMMAAGILAASPSHAATTFTVNSTADAPDAFTTSNTCDTDVFTSGDQCTLRAAIQQANATAGADTINFAIPGTGVKTIAVGATGLGTLPTITDPVTINGYTQSGASPNTLATGDNAVLKIELSGNGAVGTGLGITATNGVSVIKGLVINRFGEGIDIFGDTVGNRIEGNFIGTDPPGTLDRGNSDDGVNIAGGAKSVGKASLSALSPETTKLSGPSGTTKSPTAHFKFASPAPEATFECSLDGGAYYECSSPENINLFSEGRHIFLVRAINAEGTIDPSPAEWVWAVDRMK